MESAWILAAIAGTAVVATTGIARRTRGPAAGVLAAAPVTPTAAFFLLGADGAGSLLRGIPAVALSVAAILLLFMAFDPIHRAALPGTMVIVALGIVFVRHPVAWGAAAVFMAAAAVPMGPRSSGIGPKARRLPAVVRFSVGASAILAVAAAKAVWPAAAPGLAMAPWLFVASALATGWDGGGVAALRVLHGGLGGAMGVIAFASVVFVLAPAWGLAALLWGWGAFFAVASAWHACLGRLLRRPRPRRRPGPAPACTGP